MEEIFSFLGAKGEVPFHNALFVDFDLDADELEPKIPA
jgi:hypothetical protein